MKELKKIIKEAEDYVYKKDLIKSLKKCKLSQKIAIENYNNWYNS